MRAAVILAASLAFGGTAVAAERAPGPSCKKLSEIKRDLGSSFRLTTLTPGQFHFLEGVYVGSPATPPGMPPGDGAVLITMKGGKSAVVIWTHKDQGCDPLPIPVKLAELIPNIKTGPGETIEPSDDGDELHL